MKKTVVAFFAIGLMVGTLSGCANQFLETNQLIADANATRLAAYGDAMHACGANAACQVGVSMAYATGAGEQKYVQPERTSEILSAYVPLASLGLQAFGMFYGGGIAGTGSSGFVVTGDNNTFSGIGNAIEASGGSNIESPFSSSNNFSWSTGNRDYSLGGSAGTIDDTGIVDTYPDETLDAGSGETVTVTED